jgi:hypothetical protein
MENPDPSPDKAVLLAQFTAKSPFADHMSWLACASDDRDAGPAEYRGIVCGGTKTVHQVTHVLCSQCESKYLCVAGDHGSAIWH